MHGDHDPDRDAQDQQREICVVNRSSPLSDDAQDPMNL
jgi:hypothetical protein